MENSKTFWKDGFKEKIKKTEIDEYWLKDLDSPNESNTQQKENNKEENTKEGMDTNNYCLLYTSPSPRDRTRSRMPSSA